MSIPDPHSHQSPRAKDVSDNSEGNGNDDSAQDDVAHRARGEDGRAESVRAEGSSIDRNGPAQVSGDGGAITAVPFVLGPGDFQRIGIHPRETRLSIIRRAASRVSKSLAARQLNDPTRATEEQLYQVTLSTYRILDPRQRRVDRDRAHVGRIRPGVLFHAGKMSVPGRWLMPSESEMPAELESGEPESEDGYQVDPFAGDSNQDELQIHSTSVPPLGFGAVSAAEDGSQSTRSLLSEREVLEEMRAVSSSQSWLDHPATLLFMIAAIFLAAFALWLWGLSRRTSVPTSMWFIESIVIEDQTMNSTRGRDEWLC